MNSPTETMLYKLAKALMSEQQTQGFVGCDFRMACLCLLELRGIRTGIRFKPGGKSLSEKLSYWSQKRDFGEKHYTSSDEMLLAACKNREITP